MWHIMPHIEWMIGMKHGKSWKVGGRKKIEYKCKVSVRSNYTHSHSIVWDKGMGYENCWEKKSEYDWNNVVLGSYPFSTVGRVFYWFFFLKDRFLRAPYWQKTFFLLYVFMQLCIEQLLYRIKLKIVIVHAFFFVLLIFTGLV